MTNLSIPTLQFADLVVFLTCGIVFVCGWLLRREKRSFLLFGSSFLLCAVMSVGFDDFGYYGSWLSPLGWSVAGSLFWMGFRVFDGRRPLTPFMAVLTTLPTLLHIALTLGGVDGEAVNTLTTLAYAVHESAVAFYVLSTAKGSAIRRVAGLSLLAICVAIALPVLPATVGIQHLTLVIIVVVDIVTSVLLTTAILALEAERVYARLEEIAHRDPLTGALNRKGLDRALEGRRTRAGVIVADLDHFKSVNDRFGHAAGDHVLRQFVRRVDSILPEAAVFARFGGEEFVIVLNDHDRAATAFLAERLRFAIQSKPIEWHTEAIAVTVSLGVTATEDAANVAAILEQADAALYQAKIAGRNQVRVA